MRAGQSAMALGAAAGVGAAGLAAAPAIMGAATTGSGAAAGTAGGGAIAATQTPAGQNMLQRGAQMAGTLAQRGTQIAGNISNTYQSRIAPTLDKLNYKPQDVLSDGYAAATGNFDNIKGPGWGFQTPNLPHGAPSLPRPWEAMKNMYSSNIGMVGHGTIGAGIVH